LAGIIRRLKVVHLGDKVGGVEVSRHCDPDHSQLELKDCKEGLLLMFSTRRAMEAATINLA